MKLSPSLKATLKRLAWLWGALLGVVLFPLLVLAFDGLAKAYLPYSGSPIYTTFFPLSWRIQFQIIFHGWWYGGLGGCGAMLIVGNRSVLWRVLSVFVGLGTMNFVLRQLLDSFASNAKFGAFGRWVFDTEVATYSPPLLAALFLLFFALVLRSPHPLAE